MSALSIQPTFPVFTDIDGQPLEAGYIFIGTANLNPITNPINVFFDAALTQPAVQPIRTIAGYPSNAGTPARLYVNSDYSIQVQNKNGSTVYSAPAATERYSEAVVKTNASAVVYDPAGLGAVPTTVEDKLRETVSVKDFGAVGDGVTDDTAAIQAAFTACATSGQGLYFPAGTYNASSALTMGSHDLDMEGALVYAGTSAITFLTVVASNRKIGLRVQAQTTNWSDDNFIGVQLTGQNNIIHLRIIGGFAIGTRFGVTDNFAYNTVFPVFMIQNRIQLDLFSPTAGEYVNQNTFIGGRCSIFTENALNSFSRIGVRMGGGNYYLNNNVFLNMNFELKSDLVTGGATSIPILAEYAQRNSFIDCRCEDAATGAAVVEQNESAQNFYSFLFIDSPSNFIDYQGFYRSSKFTSGRTLETRELAPYLMFDSGPIYERANLYNGTDSVFVDGMHFQNSGSSTPSVDVTSVTINSDNLSFGGIRAIGVFARIGTARKFFVSSKLKAGALRVNVACFDASGNRLTNADPNDPYVVGSTTFGFAFNSNFGGVYRSSPAGSLYFAITNDDVATIQILISGESGLELQDIRIWANGDIDVYSGVLNLNNRRKLGTAVPTAGTWVQGDMVFDSAPTAGGTLGWICVAGGTPGTWKTFGAIAA